MLDALVRDARVLLAGLDVDGMSGAQARDLAAGFAELERLAAAGKLLATGRLVASGAGPGDDSFRDVDAWLASVSGTVPDAANTSCMGATCTSVPSTPGSPPTLLPTQRLPSCPIFSSSVIAARSSSTRCGRSVSARSGTRRSVRTVLRSAA